MSVRRTRSPRAARRAAITSTALVKVAGAVRAGITAASLSWPRATRPGDIYQLSVAGGSLFGTGADAVHPFESYLNYLLANGEYTDTVVTKVMYDLDADTMTLRFKAVRHLTQAEADMVDAAQASAELPRYTQLTVSAPAKAIAAPVVATRAIIEEPEEETKPVKRAAKKDAAPEEKKDLASVLNAWGSED